MCHELAQSDVTEVILAHFLFHSEIVNIWKDVVVEVKIVLL